MRNLFFGLVIAATLLPGSAHAAEPSTAAQERAALFQREVRASLVKRSWRITEDKSGRLVAEKRRIVGGANVFYVGGINQYAHLEISLRAESKSRTAKSALASLCIYNQASPTDINQLVYPPFVLRDPKLNQEYREVMAEAELRLASTHKAYAAPEERNPQTDGKSVKVAMN